VPGADGHLLINPYGLTYREVTASNLVKIDLDGNIVGPSEWPVNAAGLVIHTAIHSARPDSHCVMHTHTTAGSAVACLRDGLDWNNFYAAQIYQQVAYHEFEGITVDPDEKPRLIADLGTRNLMILRNHGLLALGASVPAAFTALWTLQRACEIQLAAQQSGQPLRPVTEKAALQSPALFLAWAFTSLTVGVAILFVSCAFFDRPKTLPCLLQNDCRALSGTLTPTSPFCSIPAGASASARAQ